MFWKFEALKIAVQEQLDFREGLDLETLFDRAKMIYDKGYEKDIDLWKSVWLHRDTEEKPKKQIIKEEKEETISESKLANMKRCPACGEQVPKAWASHAYKKNGEKCGHKFAEG